MSKKKDINFFYQEDGKVGLIIDKYDMEKTLRPGFYVVQEQGSLFGSSFEIEVDRQVQLPKNSDKTVEAYINMSELENYFSEESANIHAQLNLKLKMGILFSGKQGTGKTTICYALGKLLQDKVGAVVFTVYSYKSLNFVTSWLSKVNKELDKKLFAVIIFDECEYYMNYNESDMKRILDSSSSVDNCLMLFTTNYADQIPDAIKVRPSRIKHHIIVNGMEDESEIFHTLFNINEGLDKDYQIDVEVLRQMTPTLRGKTLDEIKHSFIEKAYDYLMKTKVYKSKLEAQSV